jgi:hypothetical protein
MEELKQEISPRLVLKKETLVELVFVCSNFEFGLARFGGDSAE